MRSWYRSQRLQPHLARSQLLWWCTVVVPRVARAAAPLAAATAAAFLLLGRAMAAAAPKPWHRALAAAEAAEAAWVAALPLSA